MKTIVLWIILIVLKLIDYVIGCKISNRISENNSVPLPDVLHDILPDLSNMNRYMIDDFLITCTTIVFFVVHKLTYIDDILILYNSIMLFRLITMSVTNLPSPSDKCSTDNKSLVIRVLSGGRNDLIFSGHTTLMLLLLLFISKGTSLLWQCILFIFAAAFSLLLIVLRNHYTVDVILAWYITFTAYKIYFNEQV